MADNNSTNSYSYDAPGADTFDLNRIVKKSLFHWPLFTLAIALFIVIGVAFMRYYPGIYEIDSAILVQENSGSALGPLKDLDMFMDNSVVENEMAILQSRTLMRPVVKQLTLNIQYFSNGRIHDVEFYQKTPIKFYIIHSDILLANNPFRFKYLGGNTFEIRELSGDKRVTKGEFGKVYNSFFGSWKIESTPFLKQYAKQEINIYLNDPEAAVSKVLNNMVIVLANKGTTVMSVAYTDRVPQRGIDILNNLKIYYDKAALAERNKSTDNVLRFVEQRLDSLSHELDLAERNVERFKTTKGITDIGAQSQLYLETVRASDAQLSQVDLQLSAINNIDKYIKSFHNEDQALPTTLGIEDPVLLNQISTLNVLQTERQKVLSNGTESNPLLAPIQIQITAIRKAIRESVNVLRDKLTSAKSGLSKNISQMQGTIRDVPAQERQFIDLKRQETIKDNLVTYLLQKREEAAMSYASTITDSRLVDAAYTTTKPYFPKAIIVYVLAMFLGIGLPLAILYFREQLNERISSKEDITSRTKTPILAEIAYDPEPGSVVVVDNSRTAIAEQFRALRSNLQFMFSGKTGPHVTILTSSMSKEGKSFISLNTSLSMALSNKKVAILELDLRKPQISKYLNLENKKGISNYLVGNATINEIIQPSGVHPNLFVLSSGPIPPNPSELVERDLMETLINELKTKFDEIVIDSPPTGLVTDAFLLSRLADLSIYVIRHKYTLKEQVNIVDQLYREKKFPALNIVINAIEPTGEANSGYNNNYSYGYGYYADDHRKNYSWRALVKYFRNRL